MGAVADKVVGNSDTTVVVTGRRERSVPGQVPAPQFSALTGLRAFAAIWVMLYHFSQKNMDANTWFDWGVFDPLIIHGAAGVDVFFVLSGFILTHVYWSKFQAGVSRKSWLQFLNLRVARLYPVHLTTMAVMYALFRAAQRAGVSPHHTYAYSWPSILANLSLTHAWFPGRVGAINGPAWSISAEWFAYLLFPLAYALLSRTGRLWPWLLTVVALALSLNLASVTPLGQISLEFCLGMAAYEIYRQTGEWRNRWGGLMAATALIVAVYCLPASDPLPPERGDIGAHLRTGIMLASAALFISLTNRRDYLGRWLSLPVLVYGGEVSYSLYMCHWPVWTVIHKGLSRLPGLAAMPYPAEMALAALVTIGLSMALYHTVEVPGRRWLNQAGKRFL
jgi:peptidoglycan/LPS O-acetylase OafA/YrhL